MIGVELVLGALTGFFTNDIAIRQLFNKNGIVVRERDQFTDLIVRVLKEQIVSEEVVDELKNDPVIITYFERLVRDFLTEELPYHLSDYTIRDFDAYNRVQAAFLARLDSVGDIALNSRYLTTLITKVFESDAFAIAFANSMKNLSSIRLTHLGLGDLYQRGVAPFREMEVEEWKRFVDEAEAKLRTQIASGWNELEGDILLRDVVGVDGESLLSAGEALVQSAIHNEESWIAELLQSPALQEAVYVLMDRLLPEVMGMQLFEGIQVLKPILIEDREALEEMLLESVEQNVSPGSMVGDMVLKFLKSFFKPSEDQEEEDWLTKLLNGFEDDQKQEAFCRKVTNLFINETLSHIDAWQRGDAHAFEEMKLTYAKWRPRLVQLLDKILNESLRDGRVGKRFFDILLYLSAEALRKQETPTRILEVFDKLAAHWLEMSLGDMILLEAQQDKMLQKFRSWWQDVGQKWLTESGIASSIDGELVRTFGAKGIAYVFETPMARLLCKSRELIPYDEMALQIREGIFGYLREFLGNMSRQQLDKLSREEIRTLVVEMLGREMRPLSYLGAAVGAVAGTATGAVMQLTGTAGTPESVEAMAGVTAARAAMYGAVGYGTNVMAIKGLFWPYEKKLGFQGLMSKNQTRLARKLKELTGEYVINDAIWQEQVTYLAERYDESHERVLAQGLHMLNAHREDQLKPAVIRLMQKDFGKVVYSQIDSSQIFHTLAPELASRLLSQEAYKKVDQWLIDHQVYHRVIGAVIRREAERQTLMRAILGRLQKMDASDWTAILGYVPKRVNLPEDQDFYQDLWKKLEPTYRRIPNFLLKHIDTIGDEVGAAICDRLPFAVQLGYRLAGGQQYVTAAILTFVSKKLPLYLAKRQEAFGEAFVQWSIQFIAGKNLADCGVNISRSEGQGLVEAIEKLELSDMAAVFNKLAQKLENISDARMAEVLSCFGFDVAQGAELVAKRVSDGSMNKLMRQLNWHQLYGRVEPAINVTLSGFFGEMSLPQLLATDEQTLWSIVSEKLNVNAEEKAAIIEMMHTLLTQIEPALMAYVSQEGRNFIRIADVPAFTYERICALSPEALEVLVREMAQPYFTHVERMGWWGAVVSVPATMASMMLM